MIRVPLAVFLLTVFAAQACLAADFATEVLNATFKLFHPASTATCFLVHREAPDSALYLVTAAHAFERMKGDTGVVVLRQPKEEGVVQRLDYTIQIRREGQALWVQHETQDIAVLRLKEPLPAPVSALPESAIADAAQLQAAGVHICSTLFVLTYPQRFEASSAGYPVARKGIFASPPLLPAKANPTFLADFTTFAGDSGGPVFIAAADDRPLLVGIVLGQFHHDEHLKSEYEERTVHHPLGMGIIVHAQYVRETLEAAAAKP